MKRLLRPLLVALSVLLMPSLPAPAQSETKTAFAYVTGANAIAQFRVGPQGALTPLNPPSIPITQESYFAAADPSGRFVYSLGYLQGNIIRYATRADGTINPASAKVTHVKGHPDVIAFDPTDRDAYVLDDDILFQGERQYTDISQFHIAGDGTLVPMTPALVETDGLRPSQLYVALGGRAIYVVHPSGVSQFRISPKGTLVPMKPAAIEAGDDLQRLAIDPTGHFAFATDDQASGHILRFAIGAGGVLRRLPDVAFHDHGRFGGGASEITVDPTGQFVYVLAQSDFEEELPQGSPYSIYQFRLTGDGNLTPLSPARVATAGGPSDLAFDPTGAFAYVISNGVVAQYRISPDGTLIALTPRVAPNAADASRAISLVRRGALPAPPPSVAAIVEARQRWASLPDGSPDMSEKLSPGDPSRADFFTWQTFPLLFRADGRDAYRATGGKGLPHFRVGADGSLQPLPPAAAEGSPDPGAIALEPSGRFAYVTDGADNGIRQFRIGMDGHFQPLHPAFAPVENTALTVPPGGHFLYALGDFGELSLLRIGPDGALIPVGKLTASLPSRPNAVTFVTFSPSDRFAYLTDAQKGILQFQVQPDGKLAALSPPLAAAGHDPQALVMDPKERFAYVANSIDDTISQYRVEQDGHLTPLSPPAAPAGPCPVSFVTDPSGRYAYAVNIGGQVVLYRDYADNTIRQRRVSAPDGGAGISQFQINSDGTLAPLTPATIPLLGFEGFASDGSLTVAPSGKFAYLPAGFKIKVYRVGEDGLLSAVASPETAPGSRH